MYASTRYSPIPWSHAFRWLGRASGVTLILIWTALVIVESFRPREGMPIPAGLYYQAASLAMVFAGYAIGWKRELLGAAIIGVGLLAFVAVTVADTYQTPNLATIWFAAPAVCYALAHHFELRERGVTAMEA